MSASHAPFADPVDVPRTWRRWWQARPRWLKIAVWAGVGAIVLQGAIAVRIWVGLMDTPDVARIRAAGGSVQYASNYLELRSVRLPRFIHPPTLLEGLWGRTNSDVQSIHLREVATDELLSFVGKNFPNIKTLVLNGSRITAQGLASLRGSPLTSLDLEDTNLGDEAVAEIARHPQLVSLNLSGTLVTDAAVPELLKRLKPHRLKLSYTDVTAAAVTAAGTQPTGSGSFFGTILTDNSTYQPSRVIWADGRVSGSIHTPTRVRWMAKYPNGQTRSSEWTAPAFRRALGCEVCEQLAAAGDGEYHVTIQVGQYTSKPIDVTVENGKLSVTRLDFVMPVDEATARSLGPK